MHSVSDLTTFARRTKGDVPPSLVGASTTVVGDKMYLFGGRLVSLRKMVADMYEFDLKTYIWTKIEPRADQEIPGPRYFHSADAWNNHLVIFGGMGYTEQSSDELCVLSDVRVFSLETLSWLPSTPVQTASAEESVDGTQVPPPRARYAHLSAITSARLFIIGGQNLSNDWLDDIHVYDLPTSTWVMWKPYPRHCGTYRSVAVCGGRRVRSPSEEQRLTAAAGIAGGGGSPPPQGYQFLGPVGARFIPERGGMGASALGRSMANHSDTAPDGPTPTRELVHLPYSCEATDNFPNDVFLYSNYNFTDVRRELEVLTPLPNHDFEVEDRSTSMSGNALPPGLRFPTGAILGHHLVIAGTYLAHSYQSFSIWALDLVNMTWSRIDPGATLSTGSWSRGVLWENANRFLIFGNREGNLVEDYNRRLLSWDHVAYIDLEAFGIYQPPELSLSLAAQELGLAAFEEGAMADFELVCEDGRRIGCSRRLLEDRWSWFRDRRREFVNAAARAMDAMPNGGKARGDVAMPDLPGALADVDKEIGRPDPRLTPRAFHLSEPYPVTLAFLQWMYAQALITRLQHAPPVLSALLLLATTYKLELLEKQVRHAMHRALNAATSVGVYEVATLCDCQSLQIRALKVVMSSSRQRSGARPRHQGGPSGGGGVSGPPDDPGARPRGMSDAPNMPQRNGQAPRGGPGANGFTSGPGQMGTLSGQGMNGYAHQQPQQLKLAITMPSADGHAYDPDELAPPDPAFKFGVTTPYTTNGTGAAFFDTGETLPSAVDPHGPARRPPFQPRRKDSTISGAGSDSGSSTTNLGRPPAHQPPQPPHQQPLHPQQRKREQNLRPTTADSAFTDATDRTLIQSDDGAAGKMAPPLANAPPGGVAEARMRRLLHELDSIGLTDEMTIGRNSHDIDEWAASSSIGHGTAPAPMMATQQRGGPPTKFTRQEEIQRLQQMNHARNNWQPQGTPPPGAPGRRSPYGQNSSMTRNYSIDASEAASPSEPDDTAYYGGYPQQQQRMGPYSPQTASPASRGMSPQQTNQGMYSPAQPNRMVNSAAFPMPPRSMTPTFQYQQPQQSQQQQQQQVSPPASRAPRRPGTAGDMPKRPGTAGNDPPIAYYNTTTGHNNAANRNRFGSEQNLRERYLASGPQGASQGVSQGTPSISSSQQSQMGLSPISPTSAPAMTISSPGSRTNSVGSGALETPLDGNSPMVTNQMAQSSTSLDPIKEKPPSVDLVITTPQANGFNRAESSATPTMRRSLDTGLMLKTQNPVEPDSSKEKGGKSPIVDLSNSPGLNHNPFLGGGLSGGLMFGGLSWAVKEKDTSKDSGNPPPYRMHSPPSSSANARSNSLRAGSVGGRSDGSGSSFGDGVHHSKSDQSSSKKASSPAVALATAFVKEGVVGLSNPGLVAPSMTKAEKAAEKARLKAEKAAQKAEEARMRVEEEKDAKKNEAELRKKRKEEKVMKRLQVGDMGLYGGTGIMRFNA